MSTRGSVGEFVELAVESVERDLVKTLAIHHFLRY
jgi:hypothetical protein